MVELKLQVTVSHSRFGGLNLGSLEEPPVLLTSELRFMPILAVPDEKKLDQGVAKPGT